ncbi:MAG TPA: hypothetical protein VMR52_01815 [Dehalococcoidia bacterium]|nr:hypothetical protein [Dehalococcoidia bacterium]
MEITLAFLADAANAARDGKLNALGIFDELIASSFPTMHPEMQLVFQWMASGSETGDDKRITISLMDEDANERGLIEASLTVPESARPGLPVKGQEIVPVKMMTFEKPGIYAFVIAVDDSRVEVPLHLRKIDAEGNSGNWGVPGDS